MKVSKDCRALIRELEAAGFEFCGRRTHPKWRHPVTGMVWVFPGSGNPNGRTLRNVEAGLRRMLAEHRSKLSSKLAA